MRAGQSFGVVIPTFNRGRSILRTLDAVLSQTYPAAELIVVDDGSTDNTLEVVAPYVERHSVKVVAQPHLGANTARNRGASECSTEYIAFLDSDDTVAPNWLYELSKATVDESPDVVFCGYQERRESDDSDLQHPSVFMPGPLWYAPGDLIGCFDHGGTFACRRELFMRLGGFLPGLRSSQITEFGIRLANYLATSHGSSVSINKPLVTYYVGRKDNIRGNPEAVVEGSLRVMEIHEHLFATHPSVFARECAVIGVRLMALGRTRQGRWYLRRSVRLAPTLWKSWTRLGMAYMPLIHTRAWAHLNR